ncbi:MAG: hypothetical protein WKF61_01250, partial [Luteimonas sp.]
HCVQAVALSVEGGAMSAQPVPAERRINRPSSQRKLGSIVIFALETRSNSKMDSSFRWNDEPGRGAA